MSEREAYNRDGFYIARGLLPEAAVKGCMDELRAVVRAQLARLNLPQAQGDTNADWLADCKALFAKDMQAYLASLRVGNNLLSLHDLLRHPNIERVVRALGVRLPCLNTGPMINILSNDLRVPGGYFGQGVHQDFSSTQASLNGVTVWVALSDVGEDFFPLEVIPRSHMAGLLPGKVMEKEHYYAVDPASWREEEFVRLSVKSGDVVFFTMFTVHRSGIHGHEGVRLAASVRYEDALEPTYIARGYPNAYKRVVEREILHPGFPTPEELKTVFGA